MRNLTRHIFWAATLAACCGTGAFADVNMTLTGVGLDGVMGGVYTSPYSMTVNGTPMLLICDDFIFNIPYVGYQWTAETTSLSTLQAESSPSTSVNYDQAVGQTNPEGAPGTCTFKCAQQQISDYETAAVLAAELLALPSYNTEEAGDLSYAIWGIFDPALLGLDGLSPPTGNEEGALSTTGCVGTIPGCGGDLGAANYYLQQAEGVVSGGGTIPQLTIYTAVGSPNSQEFLGVSMSEPSYPAILALDLLAVAGLLLFFRRRRSGVIN